jgi:hypothetical protein
MTDNSSESAGTERVPPIPPRLPLEQLVYAVVLLGLSVSVFGPAGLCPGVPILLFWALVFHSRSRPRMFVIAGLVLVMATFLLLPAISVARGSARHGQCSNNLKQIALALHGYHKEYGCFPPAYIPDETGKLKHSWRVLVLPFFEQRKLYDAYNFDEPWDGPNNRTLLRQRPPAFFCPTRFSDTASTVTCTHYVAVTGPSTTWPGQTGRKRSEISDSAADTVLIMEVDGNDIPWTEPRDLTYAEAIAQTTSTSPQRVPGHRYQDFLHACAGRYLAMADGRVRFAPSGVDPTIWPKLLTCDDGTKQFELDSVLEATPSTTLRTANCIWVCTWIVVVLFPVPWVWLNPRSGVPE